MASPISHSLAGISIYVWCVHRHRPNSAWNSRRTWIEVAAFVLLANLPDFDFLAGWLLRGDANVWHHKVSHSVFVAIGVSLLLALIWPLVGSVRNSLRVFLFVIGSHLFIDFFTGPQLGLHPTFGIPLLMPISETSFRSPLTLLVGPRHDNLERLISMRTFFWLAYEFFVCGPIAALIYFGAAKSATRVNAATLRPHISPSPLPTKSE